MNTGRTEYTFFWFIENYSYCWHKNGKKLISPNFTVDELEGTTWGLELYPRGDELEDKGYLSLFLYRSEQDDGPRIVSIKYELLILTADKSCILCEEYVHKFKRGDGYGGVGILNMDELLLNIESGCLSQDILNVRCRIWKGEGNDRNIGQSSARTRIRIEKNYFLHVVENFSKLRPNVKHSKKIRTHSKKDRFITSSLYLTQEKLIVMEIVLSDMISTNQILCKCEISLLDGFGNMIECGVIDNRCYAVRETTHTTSLFLSKEVILNRKNEYLPNDELSLICECIFSSGPEFKAIEETSNEIPLALIKQKRNNVTINNDHKAEEKLSTNPSALEDIKSLYINQCLTDVEVKTKTKSFPAHKIVLCARSTVFKAMMTNDMKEKITDSIQVDDIKDDIVQQMLLFLYSDNIDNLQWESATQLYYAADKYQIGKLKEVCASFLIENLNPNNAGELLLLADTHSDNNLREGVEDFILENEEQVFGSKEWDVLMETNPVLVMKAMHLKYKKKK
ncbi:unnamed protein product [Larinioides sclopetarius]|uniref:Speckle-type POZ protein n=1 Tax=Larinioides sclopetarius TaxID=280406 RepID=A0AAV1ZHW8_9ARAC